MMIQRQEHCEKGVTDGQTDELTDKQMDRLTEVILELLGHS